MTSDLVHGLIDTLLATKDKTTRSALIVEHQNDFDEKFFTAIEERVQSALTQKDFSELHTLLDAAAAIGECLAKEDVLYSVYLLRGFAFSTTDEGTALLWFQKALEKALTLNRDMESPYRPDSSAGLAIQNIASITYRQGMQNMGGGNYPEAIRLFTTAMEYYQQLNPPSGLDYCYKFLAYTYEYAEDYVTALPFYEKAMAQFLAFENENQAAATLMSKAGCLKTLSRYTEGISALERAAAFYNRLADYQNAAEASVRIADIYLTRLNDPEKALDSLREPEKCGFREQESMALMQIAAAYLTQGRYNLMLESLEKAKVLLDPPLSDFERGQLIDVYDSMAEAYFLLRNFNQAEEAEQKALELSLPAEQRSSRMHLYESMGNRAFNLGFYEHALKHYEDAVTIAGELADVGTTIRVLNSKGNVYLFLHSQDDAARAFDAALSLCRQHGFRSSEIKILIDKGYGLTTASTGAKPGRLTDALNFYQEALTLCGTSEEFALLAVSCRKAIANLKSSQGLTCEAIRELSEVRDIHHSHGLLREELYDLIDLGMLLQNAKEFTRSKEIYTEALGLSDLMQTTDEKVNCLHGLAFSATALGRHAEALAALNVTKTLLDPARDRFLLLTTHYGLGIVHKKSGKLAAAAEEYLRAWDYIETLRSESSTEELRIGWMTNKKTLADEIVETLILLGRTEDAYGYVEKSKSRVLAELLALATVRRPEEIKLSDALDEDNFLATARRIRRDMRQDRGGAKACLLAEELSRVSEKLDGLWRSMRTTYAGSRKVAAYLDLRSGASISAGEALKMLENIPGTAAIVEYYPHRDRLYIFIGRSDRERPIVVEVGLSEQTLQERIADGIHSGSVTMSTVSFWEANLTGMLIDPVVQHLEGCTIVYLVPFGDMVRLPLHAFTTQSGFRLIEKYDVLYVPSTTLLRFCLEGRPHDFSEALVMAFQGKPPLKLLDCAADEAHAVAQKFKKSEVLIGTDATLANLMAKGTNAGVIHIVCHGEFNPDEPMDSCLYLADGKLSADAIFRNMQLTTDLVVLSACQTAQASSKPGDETCGLVRAFFHAGAASILVSLWNVNDKSAPVFMEKFYVRAQSMTLARALAETQREMIGTSGARPYHWAPFILVGKY